MNKTYTPEEIAEFEAAKEAEKKERSEVCLKEWQSATEEILKKYNCKISLQAQIIDEKSSIGIFIMSN